jgi:HAD superfamily hydrolase (TIGR01450 family)
MALADSYDGFLFDLDGVVWLGTEAIPGAAEAIGSLIAAGKGVAFLTNNPRATAGDYAERLRRMGIEVAPERVVTAGAVTAGLAAAATGARSGAFVIGTDSFRAEVAAAGTGVLEGERGAEAGVVVVSGHSGFDYAELRTATAALHGGAQLFATNRDPTMPMPGGPWPGTGSILAAVETASGSSATVGGKPQRPIFERARELVGGSRVAMVGDRLDSDIGGAAAAGLETILVLTGATSAEQAERSEVRPGQILDVVADLTR